VLRYFPKGQFFKKLVSEKGKDKVEERIIFLDLEIAS
jgi:hypothetical protein